MPLQEDIARRRNVYLPPVVRADLLPSLAVLSFAAETRNDASKVCMASGDGRSRE
jgi:hypothetical protein